MAPTTRAVIFDLDGVLVDTEPLYTIAIQEVVSPYGKTYDWALKQRCMGNASHVSARLIVDELGLPITPEDFLARRKPVLERLFESVPEVAGASELVRALHARGLKLGIATSSDRRLLLCKTQHHAWMSCISAVVCADDAALARPKPAPDVFLLAAERLGCSPGECVVFEDSPAGVTAAVSAGMRVIALVDPNLDLALFAGAERVIRSYAELEIDALAIAAQAG